MYAVIRLFQTVRHNTTWSWRKKDEPDMTDKVTAVDDFADKGPSKHMQKKAKRQAKREAKVFGNRCFV